MLLASARKRLAVTVNNGIILCFVQSVRGRRPTSSPVLSLPVDSWWCGCPGVGVTTWPSYSLASLFDKKCKFNEFNDINQWIIHHNNITKELVCEKFLHAVVDLITQCRNNFVKLFFELLLSLVVCQKKCLGNYINCYPFWRWRW